MARITNNIISQYLSRALSALCLTLLLAGCSHDSDPAPDPVPNGTPLGFSTNFDIDSRATAVSNILDMGIFAYYTEQTLFDDGAAFAPNFMYNQLATKEGGVWGYSPLKYWPNADGDRLSFFAYTPHTDNCTALEVLTANTDPGYPRLRYTLPTYIPDQVDVLTAVNLDQTRTSGAVSFAMNHALTQIRFSAKRKPDTSGDFLTSMKVTGVTLKGGSNTGIAILTPAGIDWEIPITSLETMHFELTSKAGLIDTATYIKLSDDEFLPLTTFGYDLMLMPQPLDDIFIDVDMYIETRSGAYPKSASFPLKGIVDWKPGTTINYQLTLDWNSISELTANSMRWTSGTVTEGGTQIIE